MNNTLTRNHSHATTFKRLFAFCAVILLSFACSRQTEQIVVNPNTKETFISKAMQDKIAKETKILFENLDMRMLKASNAKSGMIDSILQSPAFMLNQFLSDIQTEDSITYYEFTNSTEGQSFISQNLNAPYPTNSSISPELITSAENYFNTLFSEMTATANGADTSSISKLTQKLTEITTAYESEVVNIPTFSFNEKVAMLLATTYVLSNAENIVRLAGNLSPSEYQSRGRFWRGLGNVIRAVVRVTVTVVANVVAGAFFGAMTAIGRFGLSGIPFSILSPPKVVILGAIIGGTFGLVRSVVKIPQNRCWDLTFYQVSC